jgi:hypothetical protein
MAVTIDQLQAARDKLVDEMGKGYSRVEFEGRGLTYRPQAELEAALRQVDAEIARLQNPAARQFTVQTNRGF